MVGELHPTMRKLALGSAAVGVLAAAVFAQWPELDVQAAELFYLGGHRFAGNESTLVGVLRNVLIASYFSALIISCVAACLALCRAARCLGFETWQWLFVATCLAIGPGLVANVIFKDNWGRTRPRNVEEFDGKLPFTPAMHLAQNCERNCSFVSGEASSAFVLFFSAVALFPRRTKAMISLGLIVGGVAGVVRMSQGGHFLSDVTFAGVFMALTVCAVFYVFDAVARVSAARAGAS